MKKYACTFLALVLALALLAGCGSSGSSSGSSQTSSAASSAESQSSSADGEEIPGVTLDTAPVELIQFEEPTGPQATISTSMGDIVVVLFPQQAPKAVENFITHAKEGYYDGLLFHRVIDDFMIQGGDPNGNGTGGESIWGTPFEDEFSDSLHNFRGALSMANSGTDTNGSQFFIVQSGDTITEEMMSQYAQVLYTNLAFNQAQRRIYDKIDQGLSQEEVTAYMEKEQAAYDALASAPAPEEYVERIQPALDKYAKVGGTPWLDNKHTVFGQVIEGMDVVDAIAAVATDDSAKPVEDVTILSITISETPSTDE